MIDMQLKNSSGEKAYMAKIIEVPVLVVGGGPVGMSMAIALRHF